MTPQERDAMFDVCDTYRTDHANITTGFAVLMLARVIAECAYCMCRAINNLNKCKKDAGWTGE